ncbi:MAG TPA: chitobiase/beta-hexosaminidase C-terminal domain-containing protein, partial [Opitutaceae bacterium]|nr:chitobiase/beta-hexosaminidase C-terminal domain-containing protein [Opitutaceae bacterium]
MKNGILRLLTWCFIVLSTSTLLHADREADRRREIIPVGHTMHPPIHQSVVPFASGLSPTGYTPQQIRHAYGFDQLSTTGAGQTIAIVDAYGSPTIQADLDTFCAQFGIPSTTVAIYYPQGTPGTNSGWASETSLDVEWAHAIAPDATIALVAAKSASTTDLFAAVDYAVGLGARQISMSWGGSEFSTESTSDFHFNVSGVSFFASSGDSGAGVSYPAASPFVVGVGGTSLHLDSSNNVTSETAWSGSGGGISVYESIPSFQTAWLSGTKRGVPDVAYDADPATGVPVYITGAGWAQYGGTSMAAPQWAALSAIVNSLRSQSIDSAPSLLYSLANSNYAGYFRDITSGSNGNPAGTRYDLVTGLGSPLGNQLVLALSGAPPQAAAPVFSPAAGVYLNAQTVTITSATSGVSIRYTTDGSTPTETNGTLYSGPVSINSTVTLQAIAYETGFTDSSVTSGTYTIGSQQVAAPTFTPAAGNYITSVIVAVSTATSGATIRYTTDGSAPSETNGTLYSGPVSFSTTTTLQAIAYESGFVDSNITSGTYKIFPPQPILSPGTGTYSSAVTVSIISTMPGVSIRYTTDGSTPAFNSGTLYSGPFSITTTTTLKALAYYQSGSTFYVGPVATGIYTFPPAVAAPAFSPAAGTYTSGQAVTITSVTPGASIRYTTNGVPPSETYGTLYSGAVTINTTATLQAIAYGAGLSDSNITAGTYTINLPPEIAPVFSPAAGTYANTQTV